MERADLERAIKDGLSTHKIAGKLKTSQTNVRHWLKKFGLKTRIHLKRDDSSTYKIHCVKCGKRLKGFQSLYCSRKCMLKGKHGNYYGRQKTRSQKIKRDIIKALGGKCSACGYGKNIAAMEFHHVDPSRKTLHLDARSLGNMSVDKLLQESEKCILLCSNCHRELHHPDLSFTN